MNKGKGQKMRNTILYAAFSLILGLGVASGQNIVLENEVDIGLLFPIADIDGDGTPEMVAFDEKTELVAIYDGSSLQLKWTLPASAEIEALLITGAVEVLQHVLSPLFDFNSDGKKDILLTLTSEVDYNTTGFKVHSIVDNSTIYEFIDPLVSSYDETWGWAYLADVDGDNEVEIVASFNYYSDSGPDSARTLIFSTGINLSSSQQSMAPMNYQLFQNYPNPFNPATNINYHISQSGHIAINIYNIKGKLVDTVFDMQQTPGQHSVVWNADRLSSGLYFYQIVVDDKPIATRKAIYLK